MQHTTKKESLRLQQTNQPEFNESINSLYLKQLAGWWLNQPILKTMLVKMGSSSLTRGENSKNIWVATTYIAR